MNRGVVIWLLWNLFLAYLPVALAYSIAHGLRRDIAARHVRRGVWLPLLMVWLLFLPNTCYLLTEWRHYLNDIGTDPAFYPIYHDGQYPAGVTLRLLALTAFYAVYSGLGLLALFLAVHPLKRLAGEHWGRPRMYATQALLFLFCAVGVYLGLVNRFNSWDIVRLHTAPAIVETATGILTRPLLLLLLGVFAGLLWLLYALFDIWVDGARARFHIPTSASRSC